MRTEGTKGTSRALQGHFAFCRKSPVHQSLMYFRALRALLFTESSRELESSKDFNSIGVNWRSALGALSDPGFAQTLVNTQLPQGTSSALPIGGGR